MEELSKAYKLYRSYSVVTDYDEAHILNGRCPNYALSWGIHNQNHWPIGHDYYLGNGTPIKDNSKELREILSIKLKKGLNKKLLFCDLDGVLADFDEGVKIKFKKSADELDEKLMWGVINKSKTFFENLPWMPKGRELWENIKEYDPIILTGIPFRGPSAAEQKRKWCARELGEDVHVITCKTVDKPKYCLMDSLLIDDRTVNLKAWNDLGGKFVLYDEDFTEEIIERIKKLMG